MTGNDAAAKRDVLTALTTRFPPARVVVAETYVQGPRAAPAIVDAIGALCEIDDVDVIVLARGGGSFEDLLPFSDERLVRAVASCRVPIVSAVGHEQDTPLTDLAADVRASTPSVAARLVVPDADELRERLEQTRDRLRRAARRRAEACAARRGLRTAASALPHIHARARIRHRPPRREDRPWLGRDRGRLAGGRRAPVGAASAPRRGDSVTFEEAQKELERIVQQLETGQADLDEAITLWERGEALPLLLGQARLCAGQDRGGAGSKPFARPNLLRIRPDGRPGHHPAAQDRAALLGPERQGARAGRRVDEAPPVLRRPGDRPRRGERRRLLRDRGRERQGHGAR